MLYWDDDDFDDDDDDDDDDDPFDDDDDDKDDKDDKDDDDKDDDENKEDDENEDAQAEEEEQQSKKDDDDDDKPGKPPKLKKMVATAKAYGFPAMRMGMLLCPACHQKSVFPDKIVPMGVRATVTIVKACLGAADMTSFDKIPRFVCLNKSCKLYYPKHKEYLAINPTTKQLQKLESLTHKIFKIV